MDKCGGRWISVEEGATALPVVYRWGDVRDLKLFLRTGLGVVSGNTMQLSLNGNHLLLTRVMNYLP